jgi:hypothetical protein
MESGSLNLLEPYGPRRACYGIPSPLPCVTIILDISALETSISQKTSVCLRVVQWQTQPHTNTERTVRNLTVLRTPTIKRHSESPWYSVSIWRTLKKLLSRSWFTPVVLKRMTGFFRLVGASVPCWYTGVKECWEFLLTALVVRWRPKVSTTECLLRKVGV